MRCSRNSRNSTIDSKDTTQALTTVSKASAKNNCPWLLQLTHFVRPSSDTFCRFQLLASLGHMNIIPYEYVRVWAWQHRLFNSSAKNSTTPRVDTICIHLSLLHRGFLKPHCNKCNFGKMLNSESDIHDDLVDLYQLATCKTARRRASLS